MTIIREETAAGVGSGRYSICDISSTGRVRASRADRKAEIVTSLKEKVKAMMAPATMPGTISGKTTSQKALQRVAPRLCAASSREMSLPAMLDQTARRVNGVVTMVWPMIRLSSPASWVSIRTETLSRAKPTTTPGMMSGLSTAYSNRPRP